ncbi:hypothetical protein ARMSODRAFT_1022361 [Armillaria solidipes]|uniref:Uncharacterized protein n=1 Tax=Armillaria solidipes TaxID=1076256 RepID=A0A2H3BDX3_9AGAR|nr:hypothetical protein ARMSODRAFT_1022361 [Armillaria solidipes]
MPEYFKARIRTSLFITITVWPTTTYDSAKYNRLSAYVFGRTLTASCGRSNTKDRPPLATTRYGDAELNERLDGLQRQRVPSRSKSPNTVKIFTICDLIRAGLLTMHRPRPRNRTRLRRNQLVSQEAKTKCPAITFSIDNEEDEGRDSDVGMLGENTSCVAICPMSFPKKWRPSSMTGSPPIPISSGLSTGAMPPLQLA